MRAPEAVFEGASYGEAAILIGGVICCVRFRMESRAIGVVCVRDRSCLLMTRRSEVGKLLSERAGDAGVFPHECRRRASFCVCSYGMVLDGEAIFE